jgi:hypothetical protein
MVLDEITSALEKRRADLVDMLENRNEALELEKQHQIYGAINEIDLFLQTLNYYEKTSNKNEIVPITLAKPPESKKDPITRLFEGIKGKVSRNQ